MRAADTPQVQEAIQRALASKSATTLSIISYTHNSPPPPPLTDTDAQCIIECLRGNPHLHTLIIITNFHIQNPVVLNVFRNGLPLCPAVTTVNLCGTKLSNEGLECLLPAFYNTPVMSLHIGRTGIQGDRGGEFLRHLLDGNNTLQELSVRFNPIGPEGARGLGINRLQKLNLSYCSIGNDGLANLLPPGDGMIINSSLLHLDLSGNRIEGEEGGRQAGLLLTRVPTLKVLCLAFNPLGPLGARALAPGITAASQLESLLLCGCVLGNDGVANLVPDGQANRTLTNLDVGWDNNFQGLMGGENVVALAARCTNLDSINVWEGILSPDQQRRMSLLLDRKRLCTKASALGGSPFSVLFRAVEEAHRHEHGLGAIFLILQNDGNDYFCTANNRAIE